ncbi:DUF4880 domain-containing protein [Sphingomonadaceae bacterium jetA1]|uniref:FecR family protein n=1 Tax=Facivitalis istanbulensis TaxID=3075838 RepID=UPI00347B7622
MNDQQRQDEIARDAAEWLAALDSGRADRAAFEAWRAADPAHAIAFIRADRTWRQLDRFSRIGERPADPEPDAVAGDDDVGAALTRPTRRRLVQAAGLGTLAVAGGTILAVQRAAANVIETAVGERRRFFIDEKTCLNLNTATRVRWWRADDGLEVELDRGQLLIDLAPGAPVCTVRAGPAELRLGSGAFDVRLTAPEKADVVAIRGRASLTTGHGGRALPLQRRERLSVSAEGATPPERISDDAIRVRSAWREGEVIFEGQTLSEAIAEYNRYLRKPIVLADPAAGDVRLGGRFLTDDPGEFLEALRVNFGLRADILPDQITLHARGRDDGHALQQS